MKVIIKTTGILVYYFSLGNYFCFHWNVSRSQWPRGLRRRSSAARLLRLWVRIPPGLWMFVCCVCYVLSLRRTDNSSRGVLPTVARRCVWLRNLENEEAKACYRAVNIQTRGVVTPRKQQHWNVRQVRVRIRENMSFCPEVSLLKLSCISRLSQ